MVLLNRYLVAAPSFGRHASKSLAVCESCNKHATNLYVARQCSRHTAANSRNVARRKADVLTYPMTSVWLQCTVCVSKHDDVYVGT